MPCTFFLKFFFIFNLSTLFIFADTILAQINGEEITLQDAKDFTTKLLPNTSFENLTLEQKKNGVEQAYGERAFFTDCKK